MKVGDTVRFLNAVGGGKVTKIEGNIAYVEEADGFETPVLVRECVVVDPDGGMMPKKKYGSDEPSKYEAFPPSKSRKPSKCRKTTWKSWRQKRARRSISFWATSRRK